MADRVLIIGFEAAHDSIDRADFDGETPLTDYSAAVIDPSCVPALWGHVGAGRQGRGGEGAEPDLASRLLQAVRRRRREATELLGRGGTLVCFLRPLGRPLHVVRPGPRGPQTLILHAYSWLPEEPSLAQLVIAAQQTADLHPADESHPAWDLIRSQGDRACAEAYAANAPVPEGWHAVATDGTGRLLAFEVAVGQGRLLFVPPVAAGDAAERGALLARFFAPPSEAPRPTPAPDWMSEIELPGQADLARRMAELEGEIERLEAQFIQVRSEHMELLELNKLLYACRGAELAGPAASAFRLFGFQVEAPEAEVLRLRSGEGEALAVVAADDGVVDSEPYWALMRQLEQAGEGVRGVIVGNPFCAEPPSARGEPFSDLLRRGALHRGVCLLSTLEVHAAAAALLGGGEDESLRLALRKAVLETTGPCLLVPLLQEGDDEPQEEPQ